MRTPVLWKNPAPPAPKRAGALIHMWITYPQSSNPTVSRVSGIEQIFCGKRSTPTVSRVSALFHSFIHISTVKVIHSLCITSTTLLLQGFPHFYYLWITYTQPVDNSKDKKLCKLLFSLHNFFIIFFFFELSLIYNHYYLMKK